MFAVRDFNIFTPVWKLPQEWYAQQNGVWNETKELYVQNGGSWKKVWHRNYWGNINEPHPHWQYALNYEFVKTTDANGDLSWGTYWSTGNAGFYEYPQSGSLRLQIGAREGNGYGNCWLEPAATLRVNPGQTYRHAVTVNNRTATTSMSLRAYSNTTKAEAYKNGAGRAIFETPLQVVAAGTTVTQDITIPANHQWIKLYLFIETTAALPRNYTFSLWRFRRLS